MSESNSNEKPESAAKPLPTTGEFNRFLAAKHTLPCPSCGARNWSTVNPGDGHQQFEVFYPRVRSSKTGAITFSKSDSFRVLAVWSIICNNCGLIHNYSNSTVEKWLQAHPETK